MMYELILQGYGWEEGFELITQLGANVRAIFRRIKCNPQRCGSRAGYLRHGNRLLRLRSDRRHRCRQDSIRRAARRSCRQPRLNRHPQRGTQYDGRSEIPRFCAFG